MTNPNCTGAPLSWLVMEQYHLGELPQNERRRVKQHLELCPGCEKCMDSIENSTIQLKPLPQLPNGFGADWAGMWKYWKLGTALVAVAAACVLALVFVAPTTTDVAIPPPSMGYKGGDLAVGLVRHREGSSVENPTKYEEGDTFNVRVTCPPAESQWDVVVFQGRDVFFPFDNSQPIRCGNRVPLNGSFSITGDKTTIVCVSVGESVSRQEVISSGITALPDSTVCTQIRPVQ